MKTMHRNLQNNVLYIHEMDGWTMETGNCISRLLIRDYTWICCVLVFYHHSYLWIFNKPAIINIIIIMLDGTSPMMVENLINNYQFETGHERWEPVFSLCVHIWIMILFIQFSEVLVSSSLTVGEANSRSSIHPSCWQTSKWHFKNYFPIHQIHNCHNHL